MRWLTSFLGLLKSLLSVVILSVIAYGGYYFYNQYKNTVNVLDAGVKKVGDVASDVSSVISGGATSNGAELGNACTVGGDCKGFRSALSQQGGVACCLGRCTSTKKDYVGVWWCPHECKSGLFAAHGSCK